MGRNTEEMIRMLLKVCFKQYMRQQVWFLCACWNIIGRESYSTKCPELAALLVVAATSGKEQESNNDWRKRAATCFQILYWIKLKNDDEVGGCSVAIAPLLLLLLDKRGFCEKRMKIWANCWWIPSWLTDRPHITAKTSPPYRYRKKHTHAAILTNASSSDQPQRRSIDEKSRDFLHRFSFSLSFHIQRQVFSHTYRWKRTGL